MFLHVSVIQFTGGWYPSMHCRWYPSMPCSRGVCAIPAGIAGGIPAHLAAGVCVCYPSMPCSRGGLLPGRCLLPGGVPAWGGVWRPPGADGYCCGRYASYWNAFLFNRKFWRHPKCITIDNMHWVLSHCTLNFNGSLKQKFQENLSGIHLLPSLQMVGLQTHWYAVQWTKRDHHVLGTFFLGFSVLDQDFPAPIFHDFRSSGNPVIFSQSALTTLLADQHSPVN